MKKILSCIAVILCMAIIFKLSSQPANQSGKLSTEITNVNIKIIEKVKPNAKLDIAKFHYLIRKNAHFFLYLALGLLVINALKRINIARYKSITFLIITFYAISDEVHQIFVPGRSPEIRDVFIDIAGACVGVFVYLGFGRMKKKGPQL